MAWLVGVVGVGVGLSRFYVFYLQVVVLGWVAGLFGFVVIFCWFCWRLCGGGGFSKNSVGW